MPGKRLASGEPCSSASAAAGLAREGLRARQQRAMGGGERGASGGHQSGRRQGREEEFASAYPISPLPDNRGIRRSRRGRGCHRRPGSLYTRAEPAVASEARYADTSSAVSPALPNRSRRGTPMGGSSCDATGPEAQGDAARADGDDRRRRPTAAATAAAAATPHSADPVSSSNVKGRGVSPAVLSRRRPTQSVCRVKVRKENSSV